jgi:hypothetical protein
VQVINEGIDALFAPGPSRCRRSRRPRRPSCWSPARAPTALATDLVALRWPLIDKTNSQFISSTRRLRRDAAPRPEQDDTGLPLAAIRPTDGKLHLDRAPTSAEAGRTYTYQYDADQALSATAT